MKTRLILTTVFAIILFAVAGHAQNIVAFDSHGVENQLSPSRSGKLPTLDAKIGRPIKIVIDPVETRKSTPALFGAVSGGKTFKAMPCGLGGRVGTKAANEKMEVYIRIELENTLISSYSISGHSGSCGVLGLRLNGTEYFAKVRLVK